MKRPKKKGGRIYHKVERKVKPIAASSRHVVSYTSRIRAIGNSRGIILNNKIMEAMGLSIDTEIVLYAEDGVITITKVDNEEVNTDLSTWDKHFKAAIKKGSLPEGDLFEGINNEFDKEEW